MANSRSVTGNSDAKQRAGAALASLRDAQQRQSDVGSMLNAGARASEEAAGLRAAQAASPARPQVQQRAPVMTGNPQLDSLITQFGPKEGVDIYKTLSAGDRGIPKAASYDEQVKRVTTTFGEQEAPKALSEITAAQQALTQELVNQGQMSPAEAENLAQSPMMFNRLMEAYRFKQHLMENSSALDEGLMGAGLGAGLGLLTAAAKARSNPAGLVKTLMRRGAVGAATGAGVGYGLGNPNSAQGDFGQVSLIDLLRGQLGEGGAYRVGDRYVPASLMRGWEHLYR